jgi:hypothetical protein
VHDVIIVFDGKQLALGHVTQVRPDCHTDVY